MAKAYNGWPVIPTSTDSRLAIIPKVAGRVLKGDVEYIFRDLVDQFDKYVEDVDLGKDDWGYSLRDVTEGSGPSTHATGTAIDLNAIRHPFRRKATFTAAQLKNLEKVLKRYNGAIVWGGSWARADEMHFEISGDAAAVAKAVVALKKIVATEQKAAIEKSEKYDKNVRIQRILRSLGIYSGAIDGVSGKLQTAAVKKYQANQKSPFKLVADGDWGAMTEKHYQWVIKLQIAMNDFGKVFGSKLLVDGDFGTTTVNKVKTLQTQHKGSYYKGKIDSNPGPMFCKMIGISSYPA